ncbi:dihydroxyacetone kinase subunit L [Paenalkalicoccus suaedae]|uniref:phosphoenolpyruvate--glycerone phosphotransferase n=1 Tax=Paenalkalicoccus suaedae TaxID=2592382 RepID=A0A859FF38_9BACI|nr:dihydroxyacetone kinase subunit DhaL [Paenalkalicoccus suaedae]QKS71789.1 dihydroxyacetone kinase subunit L [Paenalkalicoccus suaedae]
MKFGADEAVAWLIAFQGKVSENKTYLTELDQAIGDGDHGINLARGVKELANVFEASSFESASDVLKAASMTFISKVGGASGPLYGSAFLKMSMKWKEVDKDITMSELASILQEGEESIKARGKADVGEKTMLDVWHPVVQACSESDDADHFLQVAKEAMEGTKEIRATKGRAAYLGDRSIGHIDAGAMSSYYLFEALNETIKEKVV